jgi:hypothetical protein
MSALMHLAPNPLKYLLYSELLALKSDNKWRLDLVDSVKKTCDDFTAIALEYGTYIEGISSKERPLASAKYAEANPLITTKNPTLRRLVDALMGNSYTGAHGIIQQYGNGSPLGWFIQHMKTIGLTPLKHRLGLSTLRLVNVYALFFCCVC